MGWKFNAQICNLKSKGFWFSRVPWIPAHLPFSKLSRVDVSHLFLDLSNGGNSNLFTKAHLGVLTLLAMSQASFLVCVCVLVTQSYLTICAPMDCSPPGSSVHGNSPGKNIGAGSHSLLQGIFPTQGSNPGILPLLHCRQILYCLNHQGALSIIATIHNSGNIYWTST